MENVQHGCMREVAKREEASRVAGGVVRASFLQHSPTWEMWRHVTMVAKFLDDNNEGAEGRTTSTAKRTAKIVIGLFKQNNHFARESRIFVHFLSRSRLPSRLFTVPYFFVRSVGYTASYCHGYRDFQMYRGLGFLYFSAPAPNSAPVP